MTTDPCAEMHLLIQADLDGELDAAATAALANHLANCPDCAPLQQELTSLSERLRNAPRYNAPLHVRRTILAQMPSARPRRLSWTHGGAFAAGLAAAGVLLTVLPRGSHDVLREDVVAAHIRALQPGHLSDVVSTDQHTVKPWFDGKLDYAPPVRDFAAEGFPLLGGRLDYLDGRPVAVLVYGRRKHIIDVFVWPGSGPTDDGSVNGYTVDGWNRAGYRFRAVSDLSPADLAVFASLWQSG